MKKLFTLLAALGFFLTANAQVPFNNTIEHFTNTRCGICARTNPGFFTNLRAQTVVVNHMTYHPSSPYANCVLSLANPTEQDDRTQMYNLYGGTPTVALNGSAHSGSISNSAVFNNVNSGMSNYSIESRQQFFGTDSVYVEMILKRVAADANTSADLYVAIAEDTVFYNAPNGESSHYNVFRKALTAVRGDVLSLPAMVGDSIVWTRNYKIDASWNRNRLNIFTLLQNSTSNALLQSGKSAAPQTNTAINQKAIEADIRVQYLEASSFLEISDLKHEGFAVRIMDVSGKTLLKKAANGTVDFDLSLYSSGIYMVEVNKNGNRLIKKLRVVR